MDRIFHNSHSFNSNVLYWSVSMEVIVTIVSKLGYNLFMGLTTYLYRGYNPFTKYYGHPSSTALQGMSRDPLIIGFIYHVFCCLER